MWSVVLVQLYVACGSSKSSKACLLSSVQRRQSHSRRFRSLLGRVGAALMAPAALVSGTFAYIGITVAVAVLGFLFGKARSVSRDNLE